MKIYLITAMNMETGFCQTFDPGFQPGKAEAIKINNTTEARL